MTVLSKCESDVMNSADDGDAMIKLTEYFKQVIKVSIYDDDDENRGNYYFFLYINPERTKQMEPILRAKVKSFFKSSSEGIFSEK